jgi:hypothetical protein
MDSVPIMEPITTQKVFFTTPWATRAWAVAAQEETRG